MNENSLDILHSVTIKRKPKPCLIPDSVFNAEHHFDNIQSKESYPPNLLPWRIISSGVVARGNQQIHQNNFASESLNIRRDVLPTLNLPKCYNWTEGLRTPFRSKQKTLFDSDSTMTRNCEQLFTRMSTFKENKQEIHVDPSQSVRRIIKGSGLLKSFGTGLISEDEIQEKPVQSEVVPIESPTLTAASSPPEPEKSYEYSSSPLSENSQPENNSFQLFSSQSFPSPKILYDTVVLQKTVETELIEYLPDSNYKGFQLFSTKSDFNSKRTVDEPSSESSTPVRKRPRYTSQFSPLFTSL